MDYGSKGVRVGNGQSVPFPADYDRCRFANSTNSGKDIVGVYFKSVKTGDVWHSYYYVVVRMPQGWFHIYKGYNPNNGSEYLDCKCNTVQEVIVKLKQRGAEPVDGHDITGAFL